MKNNGKKNPNNMTLSDHVAELKHRIIAVLAVFFIVFVVAYLKSNNMLSFISNIGTKAGYKFIYIAPQEVLLQQFRIAGAFAFLCTIPFIVYELVAFVSPVFETKKSTKRLLVFCIIAAILFLVGAVFTYKILLPFVYQFMYGIGITNNIEAQISIKEYISMFITMEFCMGIVTELPLICASLTKIGVLTPEMMIKARSVAIVIIFIIGAFITPPDVFSQCMVAIPMVFLYQISIFICRFIKEENKHGSNNGEN